MFKDVLRGCYSNVTSVRGGIICFLDKCYINVTRIKGGVTGLLKGC